MHPLASLQMEYSLFSRDAEEQGQIAACKELGMAMMAYAVLGRGMLSGERAEAGGNGSATTFARRLPRFQPDNVEKNLRTALGARGHRAPQERHARPALDRVANGPGLA